MKIKVKKLDNGDISSIKKRKLKKPKKPNILFRTLLKIVSLPDLLAVKFKANRINMDKFPKKEPCLILMNHSSFVDLEIATSIFYPKAMNIVCTSDGFVGKNWLMREIGCMSTVKFTTDTKLVKDMLYTVKKLKSSILMYPEAGYSFDGTSTTLAGNIGKCIKLLKIPVVTVITHGAYHRQPLYNNLLKRKVPVSCDIEYVLTKEDILNKTEQEIEKIIQEKFSFDNWKWQQENNILIKEKRRAEGLNRVLYKCPCCGNESDLQTNGTILKCPKCQKEYELTENGFMKAKEGKTEFNHIPDWYKWEREEVKKEILNGTYKSEFDVDIMLMCDTYSIYSLGEGHLIHDIDGFRLEGLDGKISFNLKSEDTYSINSDFFWYQIGDVVSIGDVNKQFYCFPKHGKDVVAKIRLATEEIYKIQHIK